mmetsp:Transcript_29908/g.79627  ORF Transcript_29908/g.79627 Transcript_29908/m.79627 type:complete len:288 (-) Transcript_29908:7-870(-)
MHAAFRVVWIVRGGPRFTMKPDARTAARATPQIGQDEIRLVEVTPTLSVPHHLHVCHLVAPGSRHHKVSHALAHQVQRGILVHDVGAREHAKGHSESRREHTLATVRRNVHVGLTPHVELVILGEEHTVRVKGYVRVVHVAICVVHEIGNDSDRVLPGRTTQCHDRRSIHTTVARHGTIGERDDLGVPARNPEPFGSRGFSCEAILREDQDVGTQARRLGNVGCVDLCVGSLHRSATTARPTGTRRIMFHICRLVSSTFDDTNKKINQRRHRQRPQFWCQKKYGHGP